MFQQQLSKGLLSIGAWTFGKLSPYLMQVEVVTLQVTPEAREVITFYMQNCSFLVAILTGIAALIAFNRKKKNNVEN